MSLICRNNPWGLMTSTTPLFMGWKNLACEKLEFVNESFCMEYEPEFDTFSFDEQCDDALHASLLVSLTSLPQ